jgi:hypothetical protein
MRQPAVWGFYTSLTRWRFAKWVGTGAGMRT